MSTIAVYFAVTAAAISFIGSCFYAITIKRGQTHPFRATWIIWLVLGMILATSYKEAGASVGLWKAWADVVGYLFIIFMLNNGRAKGGWSFFDYLCLIFAGVGLYLWLITGNPKTALYITLGIDFIGWLPTLVKTIINPRSENLISWFLWSFNAALNVIAVTLVGNYQPEIIVYPVYMFLSNTGILIIAWLGRSTHRLVQEG